MPNKGPNLGSGGTVNKVKKRISRENLQRQYGLTGGAVPNKVESSS